MTQPDGEIHHVLGLVFFTELEQKKFTICMETQKTPNSQGGLEKEGAGLQVDT